MADRGFDYQPVGLPPDPRADSGLTAEEYRERYGYGMMSSTRGSLLGEDGWISPNTEFVERLEEATAYAWQTALHGENPFDYETRDGCRDQAEDEVNAYLATDEWNELEGLLEVLEERIASDPRTIAAEARWAACMAEAGYEVTDEDDLLWLIDESLFAAYESEPPPPGEPPVDNRYAVQPWFVETEAWDELVQFELDIAARDAACTEDTGVRAEYEQQFLEQHAELVERVRELQ